MRLSIRSAIAASFLLGIGVSGGCRSLKHEPVIGHCPAPVVWSRAYFYKSGGLNKVIFDLLGSYETALHPGENRKLTKVEVFGGPGNLSAAQLAADPVAFKLADVEPEETWWSAIELPVLNPPSFWVDGQPYTIAVVHYYENPQKEAWRWLSRGQTCSQSREIHFPAPTGKQIAPFVIATGEIPPPTQQGSEGASATCSGTFYGQQQLALYEGQVIYDSTAGSTKQAQWIKCYSSNSSAGLYVDANVFKTVPVPPNTLPANVWGFGSIRDWSYDGSNDWYVGFKVEYTSATGGGHSLSPIKHFTGLSSQQGEAVPGV